MDDLIDINDVAREAGVTLKTLRIWIRQEEIETVVRGDRRRRYLRRDDAEYLVSPCLHLRQRIVQRRTADQPAAVGS